MEMQMPCQDALIHDSVSVFLRTSYSALKCGPCSRCLRRSEQMESEWDAVRNPQHAGRSTLVVNELMFGQETVDELSEEDDSDRNSNLHTVWNKARGAMLLKALWLLRSPFCVRQSVSVLG